MLAASGCAHALHDIRVRIDADAVACSGARTAERSESGQRAAGERNSPAPGVSPSLQFGVKVQLSDAARKKLTESKETIIVAGYFTGRPKQGTEARYLDIKSGDRVASGRGTYF